MKVFIVICNSWNGEYDSKVIDTVFVNEEDAKQYVEDKNNQRKSSYSASYEYEEHETK